MKLNLENYKNIVESLNEGILILDKDNNVLYANNGPNPKVSTGIINFKAAGNDLV